jgi:hypothetical protein
MIKQQLFLIAVVYKINIHKRDFVETVLFFKYFFNVCYSLKNFMKLSFFLKKIVFGRARMQQPFFFSLFFLNQQSTGYFLFLALFKKKYLRDNIVEKRIGKIT